MSVQDKGKVTKRKSVKQPNLSELQAEQIKLDIALKKIALASAINTCTFDVKALIGSTCEQIVANANDGSEIASTATQQDTLNTTVTSVRTDDNALFNLLNQLINNPAPPNVDEGDKENNPLNTSAMNATLTNNAIEIKIPFGHSQGIKVKQESSFVASGSEPATDAQIFDDLVLVARKKLRSLSGKIFDEADKVLKVKGEAGAIQMLYSMLLELDSMLDDEDKDEFTFPADPEKNVIFVLQNGRTKRAKALATVSLIRNMIKRAHQKHAQNERFHQTFARFLDQSPKLF